MMAHHQPEHDRPIRPRSPKTVAQRGRHARCWNEPEQSHGSLQPALRKDGPHRRCAMSESTVFVGIDVSKAQLDVAVRPEGQGFTVRNDEPGISTLVERMRNLHPHLVVLEATGGLEVAVVGALAAA